MKEKIGKEDTGIDLVYTWVDGSDPVWRQRHNAAIGKTEDGIGENCEARYADNDELRYSLRSAELYAPWLRKIFIVTDRQTPPWLDTSNPKIRIVDHTEILPKESLPTFNSNIIEHALFQIPELSERFLYANDDMFFNRPVDPEDFFTPEGEPIVRMIRRPARKFTLWLKEKIQHKPISHYNRAIMNAAGLIENRFGKFIGSKPHHNIDAYSRSQYRHTYETFGKEIGETLINHVRQDNDIQRVIYTYLPMIENRCKVEYADSHISLRIHTHRHSLYDKLEKFRPKLFCINDSEFANEEDRKFAKDFLAKRFPEKSSFEL